MTEDELKARTKAFGIRAMRLADALPRSYSARHIAGQLIRAGTAVGANYRAACRGRSQDEFLAKLGTVEEEADECCYWLEVSVEAGLMKAGRVGLLLDEALQLTRIMAASRKTMKVRGAGKRLK